jgi:hypothetical protein
MKNTLKTSLALLAVLIGSAFTAQAQTALVATTLTAAIAAGQRTVALASLTGMVVGNEIFFGPGDASKILSINTPGLTVTTSVRGAAGTKSFAHVSGTMVLTGPGPAFVGYDPAGTCAAGQGLFLYTPVINLTTGRQWLCDILGNVAPGFGNTDVPAHTTAAVASAAGVVLPTGPLFHITGALAITGFTIPVGFDPKGGGNICVIPDGAFTTTTAGNIAKASTGVVGVVDCWTWDSNTAKFYPSY